MKVNISKLLILFLICIIMFFSSAYGEEVANKHYHYDLTLKEYYENPIEVIRPEEPLFFPIGFDNDYLDINETVLRKRYIDISKYDNKNSYALLESKYTIVDILEIDNEQAYVLTDISEKIVETYTLEEFTKLQDSFESIGCTLRFQENPNIHLLSQLNTYGLELFLEKGISYKDLFVSNNILGSEIRYYDTYETLYISKYSFPIGNILAGKYRSNINQIFEEHSLFCDYVMTNSEKFNDEAKGLKFIKNYKNYLGDNYYIRNNIFKKDFFADDNYTVFFVNKGTYSFSNHDEYEKYAREFGVSTIYPTLVIEDQKFSDAFYVKFKDGEATSKSPEIAGYPYSYKNVLFDSLSKTIDTSGIRIKLTESMDKYKLYKVPVHLDTFSSSAEDYQTWMPINKCPDTIISDKKYCTLKIDNSIFFTRNCSYISERMKNNLNMILSNMNYEELKYIGIYTSKLSSKNIYNTPRAFTDLSSICYVSDYSTLRINAVNDLISKFVRFNIHDNGKLYTNLFIQNKHISNLENKTTYIFSNGFQIQSYPWGVILIESSPKLKTTVYYQIPSYMFYKIESNPFKIIKTSIDGEYWDLNNYYKGIILFNKSNDEKVSYTLLEGNENFNIEDNVITHKALRNTDNNIINIKLTFIDDTIEVSEY